MKTHKTNKNGFTALKADNTHELNWSEENASRAVELASQAQDVVFKCSSHRGLDGAFLMMQQYLALSGVEYDAVTYQAQNQIRVGQSKKRNAPKLGCVRFTLQAGPYREG